MTAAGEPDPTPLPDPPASVWRDLGLTPERELQGGYQSKVFVASGQTGRVVVKMIEADRADTLVLARLEVARRVAETNPAVVGPISTASGLVTTVHGWHAIRYGYVEGSRPDIGHRADVETMARTLATLHDSLATLTTVELPRVGALEGTTDDAVGTTQLIHGDYGPANLIMAAGRLKVIDFDECGLGSVESEIGNSLYMVQFDAWHSGEPDRYHRFRRWFVEAYRTAAEVDIAEERLDDAIRIRATALQRWLADPEAAPVGIRTSTPEWRRHLQDFVDGLLA